MSAAAPPPADDAGWVRVHPASPWVRGWTFLLLVLFLVGGLILTRVTEPGRAHAVR